MIGIAVCSCKIDHNKEIDREKFTFKTGDDTEIFFKNMRQSYYDIEENNVANVIVFRYKDRVEKADHPLLNLAIVMSYLQDEAYLLLEPNSYLEDGPLEIGWQVINQEEGIIILENYNREGMLEFASEVYEAMEKHAKFHIMINDKKVPVLQNADEREAFRITVADYYRLTRIF